MESYEKMQETEIIGKNLNTKDLKIPGNLNSDDVLIFHKNFEKTDTVVNNQIIDDAMTPHQFIDEALVIAGNPLIDDPKTIAQRAYNAIHEIICKNVHNTISEVGEYLIEIFYDRDYEAARQKKPKKAKAFAKLDEMIKPCCSNSAKGFNRSYLYNSIRYVCDEKKYSDIESYSKITQTHKIELFPIKDEKIKQQLINEILEHNYTVEKLKKRRAELEETSEAIDNKRVLIIDLQIDEIQKLDIKTLNSYKKSTKKKIDRLKNEFDRKISESEQIKSNQTLHEEKLETIENTITQKKEMKRAAKKQEPQKAILSDNQNTIIDNVEKSDINSYE